MKGKFITFEGFEGSGKSTQIRLFAQYLKKQRLPVLLLREPGSTGISERIRKILLDKKNKALSQDAEMLLYLAARSQLVQEKIIPALKKGKVILCDRFHDATVAYQGYGLGLDKKLINSIGNFVMAGIKPDLTILFDIDVEEGLKRAGRNKDRIEQRPLGYHRRVRQGYLGIAKKEPGRVKVIKVDADIETVQQRVRELAICLFRK